MGKGYTIRDISKMAGVSVATVSRVINNSDRVTDETREKVQKVIEESGFIPNAVARSFHTKKTKIIGCILPDITNYYFSRMFLELEKQAHENGYILFLCNSMNDLELESRYVNILLERQVDGIILMGGRTNQTLPKQEYIEEIERISNRMPLVVINGRIDVENAYIIATDEQYAVDRMVKYLVDKGHKSLGFMGGLKGYTVTDDKAEYFKKSTLKYGIDKDDTAIFYGEYNTKGGCEKMKEFVNQGNKLPSALITINDEVAFGVLRACYELGISVPDELAVFGYDNVSITEQATPAITTYSHPYEEIGKNAIKTMDSLIKGETSVNYQLIRGNIVERESV